MRAKRAKSRQGAWPDDRAIKEVDAEIPSTTAIDLVPQKSRKRPVNVARSNSFGFGGTNASLVFRRLAQ